MNTCCTPRTESTAASTVPAGVKPRYTVDGDKATYAIRVELPGAKKENVSIDLDGDVLTVHAKRTSSAPADWKPLHRELVEDDFTLRLKLNLPVDEKNISAKLEHGVLNLALSVKEAAKPRAIPVS
jgi:HSP20 family protein